MKKLRIDLYFIAGLVFAGFIAECVSASQSESQAMAALADLKPIPMHRYMAEPTNVAVILPREHHGSHGRGHIGHRHTAKSTKHHRHAAKHAPKKAK